MNWLTKIVSTTLVVVTGCFLAILMVLFYIVATLFGTEIDPLTFGSVLAFIASCMGIGYKQFKAKRETQWAEDEDGVAYKPGTRVERVYVDPRERYNPGIDFQKDRQDFSDVEDSHPKLHPETNDEEYEPIAVPKKKIDEEEDVDFGTEGE